MDFLRIHPTQLAYIHTIVLVFTLGIRSAVDFAGVFIAHVHNRIVGAVNVIFTCGNFNAFFRPNPTFDFRFLSDNIGVIRLAVIHPFLANRHLTAFYAIAFQLAIFYFCFTCCQGCSPRINHATAITLDTTRVSNHDIRFFTCHFYITF
ncbi:hypothetical protein BV102_00177 [Haemophilus influenzae]|uniref:Uncharacterized protein n=1 Tax=Haemophilus influenzae TaxID=727 RepID=A0A2S9RQ79_HAEIF|nr:hypothetical protein BV102_00177 [Haemophilus influenzae]